MIDILQWVLIAALLVWCGAISMFCFASADLSKVLAAKVKEIIARLNTQENP